MSRLVTKQTMLCTQRRLTSAWASAQSDQSSLCAQWVAKGPSFLHADSEDSDQTGWMPRLIWVFAGRTTILLVLLWGGSYFVAKSEVANCMIDVWLIYEIIKILHTIKIFIFRESGLCKLCRPRSEGAIWSGYILIAIQSELLYYNAPFICDHGPFVTTGPGNSGDIDCSLCKAWDLYARHSGTAGTVLWSKPCSNPGSYMGNNSSRFGHGIFSRHCRDDAEVKTWHLSPTMPPLFLAPWGRGYKTLK